MPGCSKRSRRLKNASMAVGRGHRVTDSTGDQHEEACDHCPGSRAIGCAMVGARADRRQFKEDGGFAPSSIDGESEVELWEDVAELLGKPKRPWGSPRSGLGWPPKDGSSLETAQRGLTLVGVPATGRDWGRGVI